MSDYFFIGSLKKGVLQLFKDENLIRYHLENGGIILKEVIYENSAKKEKINSSDKNNLEDFLKYLAKENIDLG